LNLDRVENGIKSVLILNGPKQYNELYKLMPKGTLCSTRTFTKYLKMLVEQGIVEEKIDGQYHIYSISNSKENLHSKLSKFLDVLIEDSERPFDKTLKGFQKYEKSKKYSKLNKEKQIDLFFLGSDSINIVLRWYQLLLLLTIGGFGTSEIKQKARRLQKEYDNHLRELFKTYRKIDRSLARMIFSEVFDDVYPKEKRSQDFTQI